MTSDEQFEAGRRYERSAQVWSDALRGAAGATEPRPASANPSISNGGGEGAFILIGCLPVVLELVMLSLVAYGITSGLPASLRPPRVHLPSLGLHPIVGILSVFVLFSVFCFVHGSRLLATLLAVVMTPWWAFWVHVVENERLYAPLSKEARWEQVAPLLTSASWTWTIAAIATALIGRYYFHRLSRDWYLSVTRVRSLGQAKAVVAGGVRTLVFLAVAAAALFWFLKACSSITGAIGR